MGSLTVTSGLLSVHCITILITGNNPAKIIINYVIDIIKYIGIVDQLNRNHKISNTKTALITISTNSNLTIVSLFTGRIKQISLSYKKWYLLIQVVQLPLNYRFYSIITTQI